MATQKDRPFEIQDVPTEELLQLHSNVVGPKVNYMRLGQAGYFFPEGHREDCYKVYNMEVRPSDTYVITFPKSGTTWTQELVWLLGNDLDYETAAKIPLTKRFPFIELPMYFRGPKAKEWFAELEKVDPKMEKFCEFVNDYLDTIIEAPSPRFIKSHLAFSLLPPNLLDTAKVVYVARDPRDAAVSFYHHHQIMKINGFQGDFKTFWNLYITNRIEWTPFGANLTEAWEKRHHPNMLFLFYEELVKDLPAVVRRVAHFLNKPVSEEQVARLCDHLHIDNFRNNKSVNYDYLKEIGMMVPNGQFVRKGKTGGWREYFDDEMTQQAEVWMKQNLPNGAYNL
ncbi:luciferin sulfotransferase-like [Achroia grisella]|uniref:luciferin sulfotransferase-like n=1 Tax=Achroia grisella TaxID=688607 RepID=UPI0027D26F2E|nr:luciferin sulfotransferase-like [Achroia grisella]